MPVRRAENIIRGQPSEEMPLAHGGNFTVLQADRVCSNRDSGRCKQSLWGQVGRNKKNKQTKVGAADFQTLFHSQARTGAQNMTHVKFPLFVSIIRPQLHTHTHTWSVLQTHTGLAYRLMHCNYRGSHTPCSRPLGHSAGCC